MYIRESKGDRKERKEQLNNQRVKAREKRKQNERDSIQKKK